MNLVIIGPPGSGKDTQMAELKSYMELEVISAGDIARALAAKSDKCKKVVSEGGLLDDGLIFAEVQKKLDSLEKNVGVVFDGLPRTLHQAELLNETLAHHDRVLDKVIYISLDEEAIVERLSRRMVCSLCGANITIGTIKCAECGGRPIRRADDEPVVIIKRVQTYLENTLPLISYYRNKYMLIEVNGDQSIADVARDIRQQLEGELG